MFFLNRLFGAAPDTREEMRPLWQAVVSISRNPVWYRDCSVADSMEGRFDMISIILGLTIIRMEQIGDREKDSALLTELFIEDMEGQMRESGIGDPTVGKYVGRMVSALGGRIGALREAGDDSNALEPVLTRNVTMTEENKVTTLTKHIAKFQQQLDLATDKDILGGVLQE